MQAATDRLYVKQIQIGIACTKSKIQTGNLFSLVLIVILKTGDNFWHFLLWVQLYLVFKRTQSLATITASENLNSALPRQQAFAYSESITWNNTGTNSQVRPFSLSIIQRNPLNCLRKHCHLCTLPVCLNKKYFKKEGGFRRCI